MLTLKRAWRTGLLVLLGLLSIGLILGCNRQLRPVPPEAQRAPADVDPDDPEAVVDDI